MVPLNSNGAEVPEISEEEKQKFLLLLHEFKTLECSCCMKFMGLVNRKTGALFCTPACDKKNKAIAAALGGEDLPAPGPAPAPPHPVVKKDQRAEKPVEVEPVVDKAYKNVSTVHKYEGKAQAGPSTPTPSAVKTYDAVDRGVTPCASPSVPSASKGQGESQSRPGPSTSAAVASSSQKNEVDEVNTISATQFRKSGVNPFFKHLPSTKIGEGKTKSQVLDEDLQIEEERRSPPAPGSRIVEKVEDVTESLAKASTEERPQPPPAAVKRNPFAKPVAAAAAPIEQKTVAPPAETKPRYMWHNCKYSPTLTDGAEVKTSYMWNINLLQIVAEKDEQILVVLQDDVLKQVNSTKPLTRPPIMDEMVLAEYAGDWYRGRVTGITDDTFRVLFVDFGDARSGLRYTELYEMNDKLMEAPIYSAMVRLEGVKKLEKKMKAGKKLTEVVYSPLQLEMIEPIILTPDKEDFKAVLWLGSDKHLNDVVSEVLAKLEAEAQSQPDADPNAEIEAEISPETKKELDLAAERDTELITLEAKRAARAARIAQREAETIALAAKLEAEAEQAAKLDAKFLSLYEEEFKYEAAELEVADRVAHRTRKDKTPILHTPSELAARDGKIQYTVTDTPCLDVAEEDGIVTAIVTHSRGLDAIYVTPIPGPSHPELVNRAEFISRVVKATVNSDQLVQKSFIREPERFEMYVVKWCSWKDVQFYLNRMKMTQYHKKSSGPRFNEPCYAPMKMRENKWEGKWFRAFFRGRVSGDMELNDVDCSWYCLVDVGTTIAVPNKYVYQMNFNLMLAPAFTFSIRLVLNGVTQYTPELHREAVALFAKEPNMRIKFKITSHTRQWEERYLDVVLVEPTESEFLAKLPSVKNQELELDDIPRIREEFRRNSTLYRFSRIHPNQDSKIFQLAVLAAIKENFEKKANREADQIKKQMIPFGSETRVNLGGFSGMELVARP